MAPRTPGEGGRYLNAFTAIGTISGHGKWGRTAKLRGAGTADQGGCRKLLEEDFSPNADIDGETTEAEARERAEQLQQYREGDELQLDRMVVASEASCSELVTARTDRRAVPSLAAELFDGVERTPGLRSPEDCPFDVRAVCPVNLPGVRSFERAHGRASARWRSTAGRPLTG